jgi:hypothetical protein
LYHNALSSGVVIEDVLKYARKSKERAGDESDSIGELRDKIAEQDRTIRLLLQKGGIEMSEKTGLLSESTKDRAQYGSVGVSVPEASNRAAVDAISATTKRTVSSLALWRQST